MTDSPWMLAHRFDPRGAKLADRHYSRQHVGSPQFVPPGSPVVFVTADALAVWVTLWQKPEFTDHAWPGAWVCSLFRNESAARSSDLIVAAVAATRWCWPDPPALGMITMVDPSAIRSTNPGCCFKKAGFRRVGETKSGKTVLRLAVERMPDPVPPVGYQLGLSL